MKNKPLVSVVITTYKRAVLLNKAVQSVLDQTYINIEIIIVDDNGKENKKYSKKTKEELSINFPDNNFKYIENEFNSGAPYSRNIGIKNAKGAFVAFLDDDDFWYPSKILKQVSLLQNLDEEYGIVACNWRIVNTKTNTNTFKKLKYKGDLSKILGLNHFAPTSMVLIKKALLIRVGGFDCEFKCRQDIDLYFRLSKYCKFEFVDEYLADYLIHGNQISDDVNKKIVHVLKFISKYDDTLSYFAKAQLYEYLGDLYSRNKNIKLALQNYKNALLKKPKRVLSLVAKSTLILFGYSRNSSVL